MIEPEQAGAISGAEVRAFLTRAAALAVGILAIGAVIAAGMLLTGRSAVQPTAEPGGETAEFRRDASAILDRYDALSSSVGQLLAEQERDPSAQSDPAWRQRYDAARAEAQALKATADALSAPESYRPMAADLSYGLGLYSTGLSLLETGLGMDGHGAYYYGSHGNWDLNLGATRLQAVREALSPS